MLETSRLVLRKWQASDLEPFSRMNSHPSVMRFFPKLLNKSETETLILRINKHWERYGFGLFALEEKSSGNFFGFTGLMNTNFNSFFTPAIEIGWRLNQNFWGRGYAKEAAAEVLKFGFENLRVKDIVSFTSRINHPSRGVMNSLGFSYSGEFEHPRVKLGSPLRTHVLYRIHSEDWKNRT
ncbi:GNAT family N-acetyltransferase [Leptospira licerasiae]|uniref:Acetyltransferase, GNAT family n=1 Tax=Leptospira licerasiae str. MMD4847 TaxID=1049971 RepID=A0ABN0H4T3_9LEPT|nr:GNAT family N-acetyltransferase [Leptospira licerasiae]EIE02599.1 acetyltransferase, GNAT family [Leptospira licerasiae serovar Varillal str. VAR 010]EJZ40380.1 acetyltransferase, GNAT family [Leptospira licerasiae str. MMD4847]